METVISKCQWGEEVFPDTIRSGGLFPCIAIGLFDSFSNRAYLIHEPNAATGKNLPGFLAYVIKKSRKENIKVWVTGAAIFEDDEEEEKACVLTKRANVENILGEFFEQKQVQIQWLPDNTAGELTNNTPTGEFMVVYH